MPSSSSARPTAHSKRPRREDLPKGASLCDFCTAKCCKYFALPIDTPEDRGEFDTIRWYMMHGRGTVNVFVDEGQWYLVVQSQCDHLLPDNRCGVYMTRPAICREYSTKDCEYNNDWTHEQVFETPEQLWEYAEVVLGEDLIPSVTVGVLTVQANNA